jgi:hypothetical protein
VLWECDFCRLSGAAPRRLGDSAPPLEGPTDPFLLGEVAPLCRDGDLRPAFLLRDGLDAPGASSSANGVARDLKAGGFREVSDVSTAVAVSRLSMFFNGETWEILRPD